VIAGAVTMVPGVTAMDQVRTGVVVPLSQEADLPGVVLQHGAVAHPGKVVHGIMARAGIAGPVGIMDQAGAMALVGITVQVWELPAHAGVEVVQAGEVRGHGMVIALRTDRFHHHLNRLLNRHQGSQRNLHLKKLHLSKT
jgi:hypothetical protein